jgi:hypothetical protein
MPRWKRLSLTKIGNQTDPETVTEIQFPVEKVQLTISHSHNS